MEKGSNDLEERIKMLEMQKKFMQNKLRQAGARIKDLENTKSLMKVTLQNLQDSEKLL